MSTRSDKPAAATRCRASRCCSADSVTDRTCAPRAAARRHSSPQPVPISSTRLPGRTPRGVEQAVDLAPLGVGEVGRGRGQRVEQRAGVGHASRRGTRRTVRWTGRSARRCCGAPVRGCCAGNAGWRTTAIGPQVVAAIGGTRSAIDVGELGQHADEVVRAPLARHVGLAESDQAVAADPRRQRARDRWITIVGSVGSAAPTTVPSG